MSQHATSGRSLRFDIEGTLNSIRTPGAAYAAPPHDIGKIVVDIRAE
ncbi:MAG: hypothetical protein ACREV7_11365 [Steroidobacteraceae bacterium]